MVRRWSCIITINTETIKFKRFRRKARIKIFRNAVKIKRLYLKGTRFRRRKARKIKHRTNWLVYYTVFKYWTDNFRIFKHYTRFQWFYRFFINNHTAFNGNVVTSRDKKSFSYQDQWVLCSVTRKFVRTFNSESTVRMMKSYKYSSHMHAFFPAKDVIPDLVTVFCLAVFDNSLFGKNYDEDDESTNLLSFLDFPFEMILQQTTELYKIFSILYYIRTNKIK